MRTYTPNARRHNLIRGWYDSRMLRRDPPHTEQETPQIGRAQRMEDYFQRWKETRPV